MPWISAVFAGFMIAAGCSHLPMGVKREAKILAGQLGLEGCKLSVPLTRLEVIKDAKRMGNPQPESNQDWIAMAGDIRSGDQLRIVDCLSTHSTYYYVLIRDGAIIREFHSSIFD